MTSKAVAVSCPATAKRAAKPARVARNVSRMGAGGNYPGAKPMEFIPGQWPDPELIQSCQEIFPDEGIASIEQARALTADCGYVFLDVRTKPEVDRTSAIGLGRQKAFQVPIINGVSQWSSEANDKVIVQSPNTDFVAQCQKVGLTPESKIVVYCSDGRKRSIMALIALDEAGYTNIVGMKGGFNTWERVFDKKLVRRLGMSAKEVFGHEGDSMGVHGTGAAFAMMDSVNFDLGPIQDPTDWIDYQEAVKATGY